MTRPRLVVMAGGTASGKSTLARLLAERMPDEVLLLNHDRYYIDHPEPATADFDHPDSLETDLLVRNLDDLLRGTVAEIPIYEFHRHQRAGHTEPVAPRPIILVEGILTLHHPGLVARADLRVFVHASADVRLARRLLRDMSRRGRTAQSVVDRYLQMVRPAHHSFVEPSRQHAQLVLDGEGSREFASDQLEQAVRRLLTPPPAHAAAHSI